MSKKYNGITYPISGIYLDLNSRGIRDITLIENLKDNSHIEALNLRNNLITEIKGLEVLPNLKIYLDSSEISSLKTVVILSFYHRRIGPIVFYSYPESELDEQLSTRQAE